MISQQLARMLIRSSQRTPFRGTGSYSALSTKGTTGFPQGETELAQMLENHYTPLLERFRALGGAGAWLNRQMNRLNRRIEEALSFNMVVVLENTQRPA